MVTTLGRAADYGYVTRTCADVLRELHDAELALDRAATTVAAEAIRIARLRREMTKLTDELR